MIARFVTFEDVNGPRVAINPSKITSIVNAGDGFTDINFDHGRDVRVRGSFESVLAQLAGAHEAEEKP